MTAGRAALWLAASLAAAALAGPSLAGCSADTCPATKTIKQGGACDNEALQCPYDLSPPCDGVKATSCTCTSGAWVCPACETEGGADGGADGAGDSSKG